MDIKKSFNTRKSTVILLLLWRQKLQLDDLLRMTYQEHTKRVFYCEIKCHRCGHTHIRQDNKRKIHCDHVKKDGKKCRAMLKYGDNKYYKPIEKAKIDFFDSKVEASKRQKLSTILYTLIHNEKIVMFNGREYYINLAHVLKQLYVPYIKSELKLYPRLNAKAISEHDEDTSRIIKLAENELKKYRERIKEHMAELRKSGLIQVLEDLIAGYTQTINFNPANLDDNSSIILHQFSIYNFFRDFFTILELQEEKVRKVLKANKKIKWYDAEKFMLFLNYMAQCRQNQDRLFLRFLEQYSKEILI